MVCSGVIMKFAYRKSDGRIVYRYWGNDPQAGARYYHSDKHGLTSEPLSRESKDELLENANPGENERAYLKYDPDRGEITSQTENTD